MLKKKKQNVPKWYVAMLIDARSYLAQVFWKPWVIYCLFISCPIEEHPDLMNEVRTGFH